MPTAVVCDDDRTVRGAVSAVCAEAGLDVVAETDRSADAAEMARRFDVDVVILDLSLADGSGEHLLTELRAEGSTTAVIVFSAFADDPAKLLRLGARAVVEKPDFELLGAVLGGLGSPATIPGGSADDRRFASRAVEAAPTMWRSPAGVSSHHDLAHSMLTLEAGDAILAVAVVGLDALEGDVGPLLVADCRLAMAAALRDELRVQDLLHEAPGAGGFVALLRGGDARSAGAVWARLTAAVRRDGLPGELKGTAARVDSIGAKDALARAVGALQAAAVGSPPFVSV